MTSLSKTKTLIVLQRKNLRQGVELSTQEAIGVSVRDSLNAGVNLPMGSEVKDNFKKEEYERSRDELPPPDEARRRRDSYS